MLLAAAAILVLLGAATLGGWLGTRSAARDCTTSPDDGPGYAAHMRRRQGDA